MFIPMFFGTVLVSLALTVAAAFAFGSTRSYLIIAASTFYVIGMFAVTVKFNVPLNNELAAVDANRDVADHVWQRYLREWTAWNHVRTIACLVASALYIGALLAEA